MPDSSTRVPSIRDVVGLWHAVMAHKVLAGKMAALEQIVASHDGHIKTFFVAIRRLRDQFVLDSRLEFQAKSPLYLHVL